MNKKIKFNIIDLLIVVIVIGAIAGIILRYDIIGRLVFNGNRDEVNVTFKVIGINPAIADSINDGETFYIDGDREFGILSSHTVSNTEILIENESGKLVTKEDNTKNDIVGIIHARGIVSEDGFMLGGTQFLAAGKTMTIQSRYVQISVIITEITPME